MSYSVLPTHRFEKELKRLVKKYPSLKNEFSKLLQDILDNSEKGTSLGNNCFKIRIAIDSKGKGKSGGARVISYLYVASETVYLLTIYDKSEKQGITSGELKDIIGSLKFDFIFHASPLGTRCSTGPNNLGFFYEVLLVHT